VKRAALKRVAAPKPKAKKAAKAKAKAPARKVARKRTASPRKTK
jgi:hypothetical protein